MTRLGGRVSRASLTAALASVAALWSQPSLGDDSRGAQRALEARAHGRPYTMVEINGGSIGLPAAKVCPTSLNDCKTGEISLALGIANLYAVGPYGFGASINWASTLRNDTASGDPSLERNHSRRYFLLETFFRYTFAQAKKYEFYVSGSLGGVGVNDSWTVKRDRQPLGTVQFVGPKADTIGSLGVAFGPGIGGSYILVDNLSIGGALTYENWILAFKPKTSPTGDVASLSGRLDAFHLSLTLAYRLPL